MTTTVSADRTPPANTRSYPLPLIVFGAWTVYGLVLLSQGILNRPDNLPAPWKSWGPTLYWLGGAWAWAAATPAIAVLVRRFRPSLRRPWFLGVHLTALLVLHGAMTVIDSSTMYFIRKSFPDSLIAMYRLGIAQSFLLYATAALGVLGLDEARLAKKRAVKAAELEADLTRARLDTLRRQIQPHFLFNTLNTISSLIDTDPARAGEMVARLADLLRRSLEDQKRLYVSLQDELEFLRLYTEIEQVRFEGWLTVCHEIDPTLLKARVPPMILQPLVENAIRHGISLTKRKGTVTVRAASTGDGKLKLEVIDDGAGLPNGNAAREGIGISATRQRLAHQYGDDAELHVVNRQGGGTIASIALPLSTP